MSLKMFKLFLMRMNKSVVNFMSFLWYIINSIGQNFAQMKTENSDINR